ncbi:hypothetical protein MNBD_GAMMA11-3469 [hydrothermal vent metagenome]|uniref:DUF4340 domain-containing protein n=1 Tax=hydrothermal vent metagenome TaxID=652676 RepID=A0A3B0XWX5_9ZZZZ
MNSRNLLNIALLALLVLGIFFAAMKDEPTEVRRLTSLNIDKIQKIQIPRKQGESILFLKNKFSEWYMQTPYALKAHKFRINTLLGLTQTPIEKAYNAEELQLSDYALDTPRASITFDNTTIKFGKTNPLNKQRYLLINHEVFLLMDQTYPLVSAQAASFINLSLIPESFNIIKITAPETDVFLDNNGQWQSSGENRLNASQIQSLVRSWNATQAFAVHRYLPRKQLGEITLYSEHKNITFIISDTDPWLILALPNTGIEYHLDKSLKDTLFGNFNRADTDA